jgi:hypothetical protein
MNRHGDRRLPERIDCNARARIVDEESCITECKLLDLSVSGARLELPYASRVKGRFMLVVPSKGIERHVEVVWRNGYQVGVHFLFETAESATPPVAPPTAAPKPMSIGQLRNLVKR